MAGVSNEVSANVTSKLEVASVDGWAVTVSTLEMAVKAIVEKAISRDCFTVFTLNLDHIVKLRVARRFQAAYRSASLITADGMPVVWLSRWYGAKISRVTGADLVVPLMTEAAIHQIPIFLFGTSDVVLSKVQAYLAKNCDSTPNFVGAEAPDLNFDPESPEADAAIERIAASGAGIALIALGAPKQELFSTRAQDRGVSCGFVCVGAALDFLVGAQTRAPRFMQSIGSEWLWRLARNPSRLAARYTKCILVFLDIAVIRPAKDRLNWQTIPANDLSSDRQRPFVDSSHGTDGAKDTLF